MSIRKDDGKIRITTMEKCWKLGTKKENGDNGRGWEQQWRRIGKRRRMGKMKSIGTMEEDGNKGGGWVKG